MSSAYEELAVRIRGEVPELARIVRRALESWARVQASPDEQAFMDSVALNLHSFYSGLERLFELIARNVDRTLPRGDVWHRELLAQMAEDFPHVRPAVIGQESVYELDMFRRFRHLVRNVYAMNLVPERAVGLMTTLPGLWSRLKAELLAFADFLDALAEASQVE